MRTKTIVLFLAIGAAALWFVWSAARPPAVKRVSPAIAAQSSAPPVSAGAPTPEDTPAPGTPSLTPNAAATVATAALATNTGTSPSGAVPNPGTVATPDQKAQIDVTRVRHMVSDYHTLMGENPVGTNAEIMKQMMGGNSHQATLGPPEGMSLNPQGELVDPWGTPYFFHQLSRDRMEVRSAGPDKVMWTADDVITR